MPAGKICSVAVCRSNSTSVKKNGENIKFFSFPKDPKICEEWVNKCYRKDNFSPENKRICSMHFKSEDYEDELKARLMNTRPKMLKKTAIPSLLLKPQFQDSEDGISEHSRRALKRTCDDTVEEIMILVEESSEEDSETDDPLGVEESVTNYGSDRSDDTEDSESLEERLTTLQEENVQLKKKIRKYEEAFETLKENVY